jgi:hypothetical protein
MFCGKCGTKADEGNSFCSQCGSKLAATKGKTQAKNTVLIPYSQMRVPYGTMTIEKIQEMGDGPYEVPKDSPEALAAKTPFDAAVIPSDGDLVPIDCVWAFFRHPGKFPGDPSFGSIDERFVAMGNLQGRLHKEIARHVDAPITDLAIGDERTCVWGKTGFFSIWQIGVKFDKYGVCIGIFSQTNV